MLKDATIHSPGTGHRRALGRLVRAVVQTSFKLVVDSRYELAGLPAALDQLYRGVFGKLVIEVH